MSRNSNKIKIFYRDNCGVGSEKVSILVSGYGSCIYYRHLCQGEIEEEITFFLLYVDDGLILSNPNKVLLVMIEFLGKEFEIRLLPADRFIGVDLSGNEVNGPSIFLNQTTSKQF